VQLQKGANCLAIGFPKRRQFAFSDFLGRGFVGVSQPEAFDVEKCEINRIEGLIDSLAVFRNSGGQVCVRNITSA
jgi:hypothetical protein